MRRTTRPRARRPTNAADLPVIATVRFDAPGLLDGNLRISTPFDRQFVGFIDAATDMLGAEAGEKLGPALTDRALQFAAQYRATLTSLDLPTCLVHADYNPTNLIMQPAGDRWRLAAVIDWEFAFAGPALFDLANLLRDGRRRGWGRSFIAGYVDGGGVLPTGWQHAVVLLDFVNLTDMARGAPPARVQQLVRWLESAIERPELL